MNERNRRPSKADLEEDEFLEWVLNAIEYVKQRAQLFLGGVAAVVAVVLIVLFVQSQQTEAQERASALLFEATVAHRSGQFDQAVRLGEQLIGEYAGTPAAAQGTVMLANRYFEQGRYAEAERLFQEYLDDYGDLEALTYAAQTGLAACQEARGDVAGAARAYEAYADAHPDDPTSALALMEAARCYRQLQDNAARRAALERVTDEHPDTPVAQRARQQLNMLL